jgi:2-hydroxycyclohexanecarboxyl-CoA dehydrogenase
MPMAELNGKAALVTGASRGIGLAVALRLASEGAVVYLAAEGTQEELEAAAAACIKAGAPDAAWGIHDLARTGEAETMVAAAHQRMGRIDILVNNAGWDQVQPFVDTTPEFWDKVISINYKGVLNFSHAVCRHMVGRKEGKIVNIASDAGRVGSLGEAVYAGAKGGVIAFTKSLAREMARFGVHVNCVCPGPTDTDLFQEQPEKVRQALERAIPFRRVAQPEDIARTVAFFASSVSDYVTGQVLSVSGGLTMAG